MNFFRASLAVIALAWTALAHPMGNFSVNHYSRLHFTDSGVELTFVLDLAEIPTFELPGHAPQASQWLSNLVLTEGGQRIAWRLKSVKPQFSEGAGGMQVLRTVIVADAPLAGGTVKYEDRNFPGRAGWKEIVVDQTGGAVLHNASQGAHDLSKALTIYPTDPSITPPQDLAAHVEYVPAPAPVTAASPVEPAPAASFVEQQPSAPGSVVRGDFLSRMLQRKTLGWRLVGLCLLAAFGLGAMHAMSPGHGKTIVAAYLVGSRGTMKHAGMLGFVVTFTHTFSVFLLGLGVLFFQQYVVPEKIVPALGAISGLSIVAVGVSLLYKRARALMGAGHHHHHGHDHDHEHGAFTHSHGGSTHGHAIEGEITPAGLIALGVSGGLVPCPSALILMLSAIALGRPALGLLLLFGFSAGLALVLMAIGMLALYARHLLPDGRKTAQSPAFRLIPVLSAVVVIFLGLTIAAVSAGWVQPVRFLS